MSENNERFDSAILLAIVTAFGYLLAFLYEFQYLAHFGVPIDFVEVGLRGLFLFGVAASAVLLVILYMANLALLASSTVWIVTQHLGIAALLPAAAVGIPYLYGQRPTAWVVLVIFVLLLDVVILAGPLLYDGKTYAEKITAMRSRTRAMDTGAKRWFGTTRPIFLGASAVALGCLAAGFGAYTARKQTAFLMHGNRAVLRLYGDLFLYAETAQGKLTGNYGYFSAADTALERRVIGPLDRYKDPE